MPEYSSTTITPADGVQTPAMNGSTSGNYTLSDLRDFILASKGQAYGLASLGADGKLLSSQLPDLADDVIVVESYAALPEPGVGGKIYITADDNKMFRWDGTDYVELSVDLSDYATLDDLAAEESARETADANLNDACRNTSIWEEAPSHNVTFEGDGASTWEQWERQIPVASDDGIFLCMDASAPSDSNSAGLKGQVYADENYFYICIADNTWRRVALSTF